MCVSELRAEFPKELKTAQGLKIEGIELHTSAGIGSSHLFALNEHQLEKPNQSAALRSVERNSTRSTNSCAVIVCCNPVGMIEVFNWSRLAMSPRL